MDEKKIVLGLVLVATIMLAGCVGQPVTPGGSGRAVSGEDRFVPFASGAEFEAYVGMNAQQYYGGAVRMFDVAMPANAMAESLTKEAAAGAAPSPEYSTTNVQMAGIDELDIMKNDGKSLFYAKQGGYSYVDYYPYYRSKDRIFIINSSPLELEEEIDETGIKGIYLDDDSVLVVRDERIVSYTKQGEREWSIRYPNESSYMDSRQIGGDIYLVTRNYLNGGFEPRPLYLEKGGAETAYGIDYGRIMYNPYMEDANSLITVVKINTGTGRIDEDISFLVNGYNMNIYMSEDNLYLGNSVYKDANGIMTDFLMSDGRGLIFDSVYDRLAEIKGYDISEQSRTYEVMKIVNREFKDEDRINMEQKFYRYVEKNLDKVEYTILTRISLDGLEQEAEGKVGGHPLNQFSMDEHRGNLRVATTYSGQGSSASFSKVYVLDKDMEKIGESERMGETERIYSVRFMGDRGYVVTFRQVDPLYVLNLKNPSRPKITGELKIPGYSSYLHPISKDGHDLLLGIGAQDWKLKISLFDVTDPEEPKEVDSYILNDWSDANYDHHAFMYDDRKGYAFIPGSQKMYVFGITDGIKLEKALKIDSPKRAAYIGDIAYVFANGKVVAYDEDDWSIEGELELWEEMIDRPIYVY